jgi:hypothetical protein
MKPLATYSIRAERVALTLGVIMAILVSFHVIAMQANFNPALGLKERFGIHYWHVSIFDLDAEESFGTWFSSGMLFMASVFLFHQSRVLRAQKREWHRWWLGLAVGFLVLSVDEVVGLHELLNTFMDETSWTVIGFPILVVVGLSFLPFLWAHRWRTALLFVLAGAIYGGGAVGVEHYSSAEVNSLHYNMLTTLEEGMEMFGVILFLYAVLDHIRGTPDRVLRVEVGLEGSG